MTRPTLAPSAAARAVALARASARATSRSGATTASRLDTEKETPLSWNSSPPTVAATIQVAPEVLEVDADRQRVRRHVVAVGLVVPEVEAARAQVGVGGAGLAHCADDVVGPLGGAAHRALGGRPPGLHAERQRGPIRPHVGARRPRHRHRSLRHVTAHPSECFTSSECLAWGIPGPDTRTGGPG